MDAMDVLGALLGRKANSGSLGGQILESILKGGAGGRSQPQPKSQTQTAPTPPAAGRTSGGRSGYVPHDPNELDDLLRDAYGRNFGRSERETPQRTPTPPASHRPSQPTPQRSPQPSSRGSRDLGSEDDQAMLLIRAMINAAKSDGQIDQTEQESILQQFGDVSREEVRFLRNEFAAPLDVRKFAWDVPLGQEESVYAISLMAIDLDENKEAAYLKELAHGLRLPPEVCNQLHDRFRAPRIF